MEKMKKRYIILPIVILIAVLVIIGAMQKITKVNIIDSTRNEDSEIENYLFDEKYDRNPIIFFLKSKFSDKKTIPFVETYDISFNSYNEITVQIYEKSVVGYLTYMGTNMYFDKDGLVVESSDKVLPNIPLITGLDFDYIVLHDKIPLENTKLFGYLLDLTQLIEKYEIGVSKINIDGERNFILYIGDVKVELGDNTDMNDKMADLRDIYPNLKDVKGTLDMKDYNESGTGYTLKKSS